MTMSRLHFLTVANLLTIAASAISVEVQVYRHSFCGRQSGYAVANAYGGVPPYTYSWSDGSSDWQALGLFPGNYSVTVTDSQLDQATANFTIDLLPGYGYFGYYPSIPRCPGDPALVPVFTGMEANFQQPSPTGNYGTNPYFFSHPEITDRTQMLTCQNPQNVLYEVLCSPPQRPACIRSISPMLTAVLGRWTCTSTRNLPRCRRCRP